VLTVCELTLGCHILVSKRMTGGRNGYSLGILMSTWKVPPSYGVSGGPKNCPLRCVRSSPFPAGSTTILESWSFWMSAISLAIRRVRLEEAIVCYRRERQRCEVEVEVDVEVALKGGAVMSSRQQVCNGPRAVVSLRLGGAKRCEA
jgi:hypothetical protein